MDQNNSEKNKNNKDRSNNHENVVKWKELGTKLFVSGELKKAIEAYSECIKLEPKNGVHYRNRALCWFKLKDWSAVRKDAEKALSFDSNSIKSNYYYGVSLSEEGEFDKALTFLNKSLKLCTSTTTSTTTTNNNNNNNSSATNPTATLTHIQELKKAIANAKKAKWQKKERKIKGLGSKLNELESYLKQLMIKDEETSDKDKECYIDQLKESFSFLRESIDKTYPSISSPPDAMLCKISMDIMEEPVISVPSGITYDKSSLQEYISSGGTRDPTTRQPFSISHKYIPNLALRDLIEQYLEDHPEISL